jgi:hypothetical protein
VALCRPHVCAGPRRLWERSRRVLAEGKAKLSFEAAKQANERADAERALADESRTRANRLEFATFQMGEACREVPALIRDVADPAAAADLARHHHLRVFDDATRETAPANPDALMPWPEPSAVPAGGE